MQSSQEQLARLQQQLSSGRLYDLPSQSPGQALQSASLQGILERQLNLQANQATTQGYLGMTDAALDPVGTSLNRAITLAQGGIGAQATAAEKQGMADEVASLVRGIMNSANTKYQGRYLFGGSQTGQVPFETGAGGNVVYRGNLQTIRTWADGDLQVPMNLTGDLFGGVTNSPVADLDPAVTLSTPLSDLYQGEGIDRDSIVVEVNNGTPIRKTIDLRTANTVGDLKTRIEAAFAAEAVTVNVAVGAGGSGIALQPSAGTIRVENSTGSLMATQLKITSAAAATIAGGDLNPGLSLQSPLASLNGGAGIGATAGAGLRIVNGDKTSVIDLNGAVTVQDLFQRIQAADRDLDVRIDAATNGIVVASRVSGANLSIGENGGTNAAALGIRTFTGATTLAGLNNGVGVPLGADTPLKITRRDGTAVEVDLTGSRTVQDVLDRINAVDPGNLVAGLATVGNGITLTDNSGAGELVVATDPVSQALGIAGSETTGALGVLQGADTNPQRSNGVFDILTSLEKALRSGDDAEINRLMPHLSAAAERITIARGEVGTRQQLVQSVNDRMEDSKIELKANLSVLFEADSTEVITELLQLQQTIQATLQVTSRSMQLSLMNYL